MLWSEIGSSPQIERAGMDGSKRKVVVSRDLSWPVSLAYDLLDNRVYWADEKLRCIGSASLDGDNVKVNVAGQWKYLASWNISPHNSRPFRFSLSRSCSWPKHRTLSL